MRRGWTLVPVVTIFLYVYLFIRIYSCYYSNIEICIINYDLSWITVSGIVVAAIVTAIVITFLLVSTILLCWLKGQASQDAFGRLKQTPMLERLKSIECSPPTTPQYRWSVSWDCTYIYIYLILSHLEFVIPSFNFIL